MNKKRKSFLSLMATILMITVLFVGNVNAATYNINNVENLKNKGTIGQTMWLDGSDLDNRDDVFCFEHKTAFIGGQYSIYDIVEINGKKAISKGTGKTVTKNNNIVMNYLLFKGNYSRAMFSTDTYMTGRNIAIWAYQNTWINSLGNGFFKKNWKHSFSRLNIADNFNSQLSSEKNKAKSLLEEAQNYAKSHSGSAGIEITGNKTVSEYDKNKYGPFRVKYSGEKITISATDTNGKAVASNKIKVYSDKNCKKEIAQNKIANNTNFYVKITDGTKLKKLKCTANETVLNAKIFFLGKSDFWNGHGQGIIFVKPGEKNEQKSVEFEIKSLQKVSIKGYVWIDKQRTKLNNTNSLYDQDETRVEGVTVNLVNKDSNSKKIIATTKTNSNGEYTFNEPFYVDNLKNHYVEFIYKGVKVSNQDISKFIPVAFNSTDVNAISKLGSRAIMDSVATEDKDLSGVASTYKGKEKENIYGLGYNGNLYNKLIEGNVLNNINLGLKKIPETEYKISENLSYVKIGIKGYEYTYKYGEKGNTSYVAAPNVNWKNGKYAYSPDIYPSDIVYRAKDSTQELKVNVTYRIDVTNTTNHNIEELYKEIGLNITSMINTYDTHRYKLVEDEKWKLRDNKEGTAVYIGKDFEGLIGPNSSSKPLYITFSVNRDALLDILKNPKGIVEEDPTKVKAVGHHQYLRKDYSWQNDILKEQKHRTIDDERSADAPYLIFKLGEERVLSGKVFKDMVITTDGQKLGDGVFGDKDEVIPGVKVELLDMLVDDNNNEITDITKLPVSSVYPRKRIDQYVNEIDNIAIKAETYTNSEGNYELNGLVPGMYYLRFTYGSGETKVTDLQGNEINAKGINAKDYKSTIVTNGIAKQALKGEKGPEWYKELDSDKASVAIDNLSTRLAVNNGTQTSIMAGTAKINITIENTKDNFANIEVTENGTKALASNKFNGLNFGIIEQPKQMAKLEKVITNIKLENAQNNYAFNGNPETDAMQGVSDLDNTKNGGSKYLRAELVDEYITGSSLELTYGISVTNVSDVNYYNNEYYWFGEANTNKEVTLNISEITDYLDKTLQYNKGLSDNRIPDPTSDAEGRTILKLPNIGVLYTESNKARATDKLKTTDIFALVAERILSKQDDDREYINEVKIENMKNGKDPRSDNPNEQPDTARPIDELPPESKAIVTITPPTGGDRLEILLYTISGIIALAVLSTGVIMIKKIVTKW